MFVVLADDHNVVREGIRLFLERLDTGVAVLEAANFAEALEQAEAAPELDLIILDLVMPGMNGLAGLKIMRSRFPDVPVVVLSGSNQRSDALNAIKAGAAGYIPKSIGGEALLNAVRLIRSGETYVPSLVVEDAGVEQEEAGSGEQRPLSDNNPIKRITRRERQVLGELVEGCSNKEIARRLFIEEITVKVHLSGVYRKLNVSNRTQAVRKAMELGWDLGRKDDGAPTAYH